MTSVMGAVEQSRISHSVSFIVPALNEEIVIEHVVRDIWAVIDTLIATYEIILVDDGSADQTGKIMDRLARELPHVRVLHNNPNVGLGTSYQRGVVEAKFDYVMMLCGDGGLPASSLPSILAAIGSADIVVPYMINLRQIKTPLRYVISRSYTWLLNRISGYQLNYYNGLPVHRRAMLEQISITSSGFGFQGEILVKLLKSDCSFVQVGVMGAEATKRTSVFGVKNLLSVAATFADLISELISFKKQVPSRLRDIREAKVSDRF